MRRGIPGAWVIAGLAMLGAMVVGGLEARAGTVTIKGGIVLGSGTGGDPPYTYIFDLYLTSGFIAPDLGANPPTTFFTVDGLVGVSGAGYDTSQIPNASTTSEPPSTAPAGSPQANEFWTVPNGGIVTSPSPPPATANGYNYQGNVTWEYLLGPTINYTNPGPNGVFLGEFTVVTSWSYGAGQPPPMAPGTIIDYSYSIGGTTGTGTIVLQGGPPGVPEPSSLLLMLLGGAFVPLAASRRRRRLHSRCAD
jgi:hypothetical protein